MVPKSILRKSNVDEESSQAASGAMLQKLLPPFLRQKSTSFAPDSKRDYEEPKGERYDEDEERYDDDYVAEDPKSSAKDPKLDSSLTFVDKLIDDISQMLSFDTEAKVAKAASVDPDQEQSLEITFENYVEYEAIKKERAKMRADDASVQAQCPVALLEDQISDDESRLSDDELTASVAAKWSERDAARLDKLERELLDLRLLKQVEQNVLKANREKRKQLRAQSAKVKDENDAKIQHENMETAASCLSDVQHELDELRKLKMRVVQAKENAKVQKAVMELAAFKVTTRDPIEVTVQKRLQSSLAVVQEYRAAQAKIEADVAAVKSRMSKFQPPVERVEPVDPAEDLVVPPAFTPSSFAVAQESSLPLEKQPEPALHEDDDDDVRINIVPAGRDRPQVVDVEAGAEAVASTDAPQVKKEEVTLLSRPMYGLPVKQFNLEKACCGALALD